MNFFSWLHQPRAASAGVLRGPWNPLTLAWITSAWIAVLCNWPLWSALNQLEEMSSPRGRVFMLALCCIVTALTALSLTLAAWRWSIKPVAAVYLLTAAAATYFMGAYRIVIDPSMVINLLQTDPREARDLLSLRLLATMAVLALLPMAWLLRAELRPGSGWRQIRRNLLGAVIAIAVIAGLGSVFFADLSATVRNHKSLRYMLNPLSTFYSMGKLAASVPAQSSAPPIAMGEDAQVPARAPNALPPLLLLVVGETARADRFSLNGYERPTNPRLSQLGVWSWKNVSSCGTSTAASLPCMFSVLGKTNYEADKQPRENLLDVLHRAGLAVLWLDNQSGCKGLCDRIPNAHTRQAVEGVAVPEALCDASGECQDEALLLGLDKRIQTLAAERRAKGIVVVLHQMGSHGPAYWKRSPPDHKPFTPECSSNALQQCTREALNNAYDNSIAYTDHLLAQAIGWLGKQSVTNETALLYVSDHGESLGEKGLYLHGMPYALAPREQTHVPMVMWLSPQASTSLNTACLTRQLDAAWSHDNLASTVLGLLSVHTRVYRADRDVLGACREKPP